MQSKIDVASYQIVCVCACAPANAYANCVFHVAGEMNILLISMHIAWAVISARYINKMF